MKMSDGTAKIRLKIGQLEVEYEGAISFLNEGIFNLMEKLVGFYNDHKSAIPVEPPTANTNGGRQAGLNNDLDHSTNTIAAHLEATSGTELVIAAAARLSLLKKKGTFTRKEINDEMKSAATYYKESMTGNLTKSLDTLLKNKRLNQSAKDTYALSASERKALEAKLANLS